MGSFNYQARAENEVYLPGRLLGFHPVTRAVRNMVLGDSFAGYVHEGHDLTLAATSVYDHSSQLSTLVVASGFLPLDPASGVTPVTGKQAYAASNFTFSHDPAAGTYIGTLRGPTLASFNLANAWDIDTAMGVLVAGRIVPVTVLLADVSSVSDAFVVSPVTGRVVKISVVMNGTVTVANAILSFGTGTVQTSISDADVTVVFGALIGAVFTSEPVPPDPAVPDTTILEGEPLSVTTDGGSTTSASAEVTFYVEV